MPGPSDRAWYFEHAYGPFWQKQVQAYGLSDWHRDLARRMLEAVPEGRTLEVGAGTGFPYAGLLLEKGRHVVGVDIAQSLLAEGKSILRGAAADAGWLPFLSGSFRLVYCLRSSWLFGDLPRAVDEMMRTLAPGGVLFIDLFNAAHPPLAAKFLRDSTLYALRILKRRLQGRSTLGVIIESRPACVGRLTRRFQRGGCSVELFGMRSEQWVPLAGPSVLGSWRYQRILAVVRKP